MFPTYRILISLSLSILFIEQFYLEQYVIAFYTKNWWKYALASNFLNYTNNQLQQISIQ